MGLDVGRAVGAGIPVEEAANHTSVTTDSNDLTVQQSARATWRSAVLVPKSQMGVGYALGAPCPPLQSTAVVGGSPIANAVHAPSERQLPIGTDNCTDSLSGLEAREGMAVRNTFRSAMLMPEDGF